MPAEYSNLWDDLARHCGADPGDRRRREKLKLRAYEIVIGVGDDGHWRTDDSKIQQFLHLHAIRIMRILLTMRGRCPE